MTELRGSEWIYIGNLSCATTESQIHEIFSRVGKITKLIMGLNKFTLQPCGFCFIRYASNSQALDAVALCNNLNIDERAVSVQLDFGFRAGRRFGRGNKGNYKYTHKHNIVHV